MALPLAPSFVCVSYCANVGQQGEDYEAITKKAKDCGASKVYIEDLCEEFVTDYVFEAVKANALYEGQYLLGTRQEFLILSCATGWLSPACLPVLSSFCCPDRVLSRSRPSVV